MANQRELINQVARLSAELDRRAPLFRTLDRYYDGDHPLPPLVQEAKVTKAYRTLMELSSGNWPKLVVDSVEERLEVQGVRFEDEKADDDAWTIWQDNGLDAEASMLHQSALTDGRAYAVVWGDGTPDPKPVITLEHASTCVVEYEPGNRRKRRAAVRRWRDGKRWFANLYRPEGIYKFQAENESDFAPTTKSGWKRLDVKDETWPLVNTLSDVNVVEFAVNRLLRPAPFGTARGEFQTNVRHIDRINYKVFCGLVALTWSGFPLRALIGDPILRDDDNKPIAPFDPIASAVVQLENPDGKLVQLPEATIENFSPEMDIKHLAALTKTPAHYLLAEMVNLSADAIRAGEASLISKVKRHHRSLGESWEDVTRLGFRVMDPEDARGFNSKAEIIWTDPESRSLAERADAAVKLKDVLPWQVVASKVLGMTPQEIRRADSLIASSGLAALLTQPETPPAPTPAPA